MGLGAKGKKHVGWVNFCIIEFKKKDDAHHTTAKRKKE
jgi:hypothetical protein